ncbi:MAG: hypothetical protein ACPG77_04040 [Nannocystaceae bacterium]
MQAIAEKKLAEMTNHMENVEPGQPVEMSVAAVPGDGIWQGDLGLEVLASVPADCKLAPKPSPQLVPGNTRGARHCLDSLEGVEVYLPPNWGQDENNLRGPVLVLSESRTVEHPTHGDVTIPAGFTIGCCYQREWDAVQRAERRAAD